mmetsp:Transcript_2786/g.6015  ORF Transcript_2786/g.6015 Transcript_2786/m.6015 type:complete len:179 (-) Transcript_2786:224-760(-)
MCFNVLLSNAKTSASLKRLSLVLVELLISGSNLCSSDGICSTGKLCGNWSSGLLIQKIPKQTMNNATMNKARRSSIICLHRELASCRDRCASHPGPDLSASGLTAENLEVAANDMVGDLFVCNRAFLAPKLCSYTVAGDGLGDNFTCEREPLCAIGGELAAVNLSRARVDIPAPGPRL